MATPPRSRVENRSGGWGQQEERVERTELPFDTVCDPMIAVPPLPPINYGVYFSDRNGILNCLRSAEGEGPGEPTGHVTQCV